MKILIKDTMKIQSINFTSKKYKNQIKVTHNVMYIKYFLSKDLVPKKTINNDIKIYIRKVPVNKIEIVIDFL